MNQWIGKLPDLGNDLAGLALEYARHWLVLVLAWITNEGDCGCYLGPDCHRPGKHPITRGGLYSATRNEATISGWWEKWPQANIGIRTGLESGLLILDVDPRNGGSESLEKLLSRYHELPDTLVCATGGGGWHFYFAYPGPGLAQLKGKVTDYPGLDIKADGGYVVAPPSRHFSGGTYRWLDDDWRTTAIAPVPEWLLELIRAEEKTERKPRKAGQPSLTPPWMGAEPGPADWEILSGLAAGMEGLKYQLLVEGEWGDLGYISQSGADQALFNKLARLTNGDARRMGTIFTKTGLMRDINGDHSHHNYPDYLQRTIRKAIDGLNYRPAAGGKK